ncbi:MAG: hypothetical protein CMI05_11615 [Oceanospirillaceae bacterium]|nr:hypothetical protein [Oceanospirillaceae bacterium]
MRKTPRERQSVMRSLAKKLENTKVDKSYKEKIPLFETALSFHTARINTLPIRQKKGLIKYINPLSKKFAYKNRVRQSTLHL